MKNLLGLLFLLSSIFSFGQNNYAEFQIDNYLKGRLHKVQPVGEDGVLICYNSKNITLKTSTFSFVLLNKNFDEVWEEEVTITFPAQALRYYLDSSSKNFYVLFESLDYLDGEDVKVKRNNLEKNLIIVRLNYEKASSECFYSYVPFHNYIEDFCINNEYAYIVGNWFPKSYQVLIWELKADKTFIDLKEYGFTLKIIDIHSVKSSKKVYIGLRSTDESGEIVVLEYQSGKLIEENLYVLPNERKLASGDFVLNQNGNLLLFGTYRLTKQGFEEKYGPYAIGFCFLELTKDSVISESYFNISQIPDFFTFYQPIHQKKYLRRANKALKKGKEPITTAAFRLKPILSNDGNYYFIAQQFGSYFQSSANSDYPDYVGEIYFQALIFSINDECNKQWINVLKLDWKPTRNKNGKIIVSSNEKEIVLLADNNDNLNKIVIRNDELIASSSEFEIIKFEGELSPYYQPKIQEVSIEFWYDDHFLQFGREQIEGRVYKIHLEDIIIE